QGRTGVGQSIAVVEFEQYYASDLATFQSCYGLSNPVRNVVVDGPVGGSPEGSGEAALDTELAAVNAPSASLVVYQAPNQGDTDALDVFNRIASDDSAQAVTTSWGQCEADIPTGDLQAENTIFERMALQGQTVVAASGDAGSEDCYPQSSDLGVDDPGAQPDVVGVGGTTMTSAAAGSQVVWNDCQGQPSSSGCAAESFTGSGGGGYSSQWPANPGQPAASGTGTDPCSPKPACRAVPDLSYPSNPDAGGVVAYSSGQGGWARFGGTSVGAPTNAALFADVNQGCTSPVGRVGPALYADASSTTFTDIGSGNNDFTGTNGGLFAAMAGSGVSGYDPASGLGSPVDQNLAAALQGGSGCPSVSAVVPDTGPVRAGGAVTVEGGGLDDATLVTFGRAGAGSIVARSAGSLTVVPPDAGAPMCVDVTVTTPLGTSAASAADRYGFGGDLDCGDGYRFAASDGGVFSFGDAGFYGSMGGTALVAPVVGLASTPSTHGYWEVASDGGIFSFGDAGFYGSMGGQPLNRPIVAMAATPDGRGYWEVASDGGIFSFGDAQFYGSTGGLRLNQPVVGMAAAPGGSGYWLVAADGGIFDYGSAGFFGSAGSLRLNKPVVGMASTPDGGGYWEVASDGGIFAYGDTQFYGSTGGLTLNRPIVGMTST
ncbi:MAG TPA: IPT/TIG domain-containing protein, partial [Acidimicrobiales bacterium]|nr:IPT/TIG domain-containing protein [Acidimicrobiales bacterium]